VSERTYILRDGGVRDRCLRALGDLDLSKCYEVVIRPWKAKRTDEQNAFWHVLIGKVASATGNDAETIKDFFKNEFGPKRVVMIHGEARAVPKPSSAYSVEEMSEVIERSIEWALVEFGIKV